MVKISEVSPKINLFEGVERIKKEELVDKAIKIYAYADIKSEDEDYCIALIEANGKKYTTTFSYVIVERLHLIMDKIGKDNTKGNDKELYFNEVVEGVLVEKQSMKNPNRQYFTLE